MNLEAFYRTHQVPRSVRQLWEIERVLNDAGSSLALISFDLVDVDFRYTVTPPDLIPIAHTGVDGCHFGFLTDFGMTRNLDLAPIVMVRPTGDPPLQVVASTMRDLVALLLRVNDAEILANLDYGDETDLIEESLEEYFSGEKRGRLTDIKSVLMSKFGVEAAESAQDRIQTSQRIRESHIAIPTADSLGVLRSEDRCSGTPEYDYTRYDRDPESFIRHCSKLEKLALCRDLQYHFILDEGYDKSELNFVLTLLEDVGCRDERARLADLSKNDENAV